MNALVFLVTRSFKNALVKRLRRLRDVRYLVSTIVFLGYMVLVFGSWFLASLTGSSKPEPASPTTRVFGLAAILGLMVASFSSTWLWPERNQLIFSPAEIQFLFPAPLRRETLLRLKIVKAQLPLLFTAVFAAFASRRGESLHWWAVLVGTWLAFNAAFLHRLGAALTLVPTGSPTRHRIPLVLGRVAVAALLVSLVVSFRAFDPSASPIALAEGLVAWSQRAPASWAILPFRILLRPALAPDLASFAAALPGSLAILAVLYVWVIRADAAFEEAAIAASQKFHQKLAGVRRTGRFAGDQQFAGPPTFELGWRGRPMVALVWKNLTLYTRMPFRRVLVLALGLAGAVAAFALWGEKPLDRLVGAPGEVGGSIASMLAIVAAFLTLMGPDVFRFDLRTTLGAPDLLKAIPLRGRAVFLGEILAPVLVLAATQAYLLLLAGLLAVGLPDPGLPPATLPLAWLSAVIVLLPFDLLLFVVANGTALLFPAWVPTGAEVNKRGAEAGGMRMLVAFVRLVVLGAGFGPAAAAGLVTGTVAWLALGNGLAPLALPLGAVTAAAIVLAEAAVLVQYLGGVLERFDPAVEMR